MPARSVRIAWAVVVVVVLALPSAWQTLPRPSALGRQVTPNAGDPAFVTWTMGWEAHALVHHPTTVLAGNIFYPRRDAIAWSDNLLVLVPVFGVLDAAAGGRVLVAYNLVTLLGFLGVGLAAYALIVEVVGDRLAALVGATLVALSPARSVAVGHTQLVGFLFVPLALVALVRWLEPRGPRRWRHAVGLGLAVAATWLVTAYFTVLVVLVLAAFVVTWALQRRVRTGSFPLSGQLVAGLALAAVVAVAAVAPTLPAYIRLQRTGLFRRSPSDVRGARLADLGRLPPSALYRVLAGVRPPANYGHADLYPGAVLGGLVLVALGAAVLRLRRPTAGPPPGGRPGSGPLPGGRPGSGPLTAGRSHADAPVDTGVAGPTTRWGWPLAGAALPAVVLTFGPAHPGVLALPFRALRRVVPGVGSLRDLDRFWVFVVLCLAVAAARGAAVLLRRVRGRGRPLLAAGLVLLAWVELGFRPPASTLDLSAAATAPNHLLARLPAGPVFELPSPIGPQLPYVESARQVRSLIDRNPRVDGYSGDAPPEVERWQWLASRLSPPELVGDLRRQGVRYVVLDGTAVPCAAGYGPGELAALRTGLASTPGVVRIFQAGPSLVVELTPGAVPGYEVPLGPPGAVRPAGCAGPPAGSS